MLTEGTGLPVRTVSRPFNAGLPMQVARGSIFAVDDFPELDNVRRDVLTVQT